MNCGQKTAYGCEQIAVNAAWLHRAAYPECPGVEPYVCPECTDWHIGHVTPGAGRACKSVPKPKLRRPRHRRRDAS